MLERTVTGVGPLTTKRLKAQPPGWFIIHFLNGSRSSYFPIPAWQCFLLLDNLLDWNETNCPVYKPCLVDSRSTTRDLLANHSILKLLAKHVRTQFLVWKSVVRRLARAFDWLVPASRSWGSQPRLSTFSFFLGLWEKTSGLSGWSRWKANSITSL